MPCDEIPVLMQQNTRIQRIPILAMFCSSSMYQYLSHSMASHPTTPLSCMVSHNGFVLGPLLFILYTADVVLIAALLSSAWCRSSLIRWWYTASALHRRRRQVDAIQSAEIECWQDTIHWAWFTTNTGENKLDTITCWWCLRVPAWCCAWPWRYSWFEVDDEESRG